MAAIVEVSNLTTSPRPGQATNTVRKAAGNHTYGQGTCPILDRLPTAEIIGDLPVRHSTRTTLPSSTAHTPGNCTATLACPQLRRGAGTSSAKLELVNSERVGAV